MLCKGRFSKLRRPCDSYIFFDARLAPEDRYRASQLNMCDDKLVFNLQNLFCLALVSSEALLIDTACIVSSSSPFVTSARNQSHRALNFAYLALNLIHITLHDWCIPLLVYFLCNEISIQIIVPKVCAVASNRVNRVISFIRNPINSPLARSCQVVAVREIKAILQKLIDRLNSFIDCFAGNNFLNADHNGYYTNL